MIDRYPVETIPQRKVVDFSVVDIVTLWSKPNKSKVTAELTAARSRSW